MTASEEFQAQLTAGKLQNALKLAINQAIELKITTWISTSDLETDAPVPPTKSHSYLRSRINIVDGKIDNEVSYQLLNHPLYSELQQLHLAQVIQASQTIHNNLDSLQKLVELLKELPSQTQVDLAQIPGDLARESEKNRLDLEANSQSDHETQARREEISVVPIVSEVQTQVVALDKTVATDSLDTQNLPQDTPTSVTNLNTVVEDEQQIKLQEAHFNASIPEKLEVADEDDDWGDLIEEDLTISEPELVNSAESEDWDDWEIEQPETEVIINPVESLDSDAEKEWIDQEDWEDTTNQTTDNQELAH